MSRPGTEGGRSLTVSQPLVSAARAAVRRHWPTLAILGGGVLLVDSLHGPLSSLLSLSAASAGLWLLSDRLRPTTVRPAHSDGWMQRLEALFDTFHRLDPQGQGCPDGPEQQQRRRQLAELQERQQRSYLEIALVGATGWSDGLQSAFVEACQAPMPLRVHRSAPLPAAAGSWHWPDRFQSCDHLILRLSLPLTAAELRWLEAVPTGQEVWLLVDQPDQPDQSAMAVEALKRQLPAALEERLWLWRPACPEQLHHDLQPLTARMLQGAARQPERTQRRNLEALHGRWQVQLEAIRRRQWQQLQQQTQWTVAAGVLVAPVPSLDLLVLAAANGLMLREMARLWDCPWTLGQLQAAAGELAKASLALGVVEWSSQALAGLVKWHGATWLVGGAMQALSAAYLTRVVAHAMADVLALSAGVSEPDLAAIKRQAPLLVARAAEAEKLDWPAFLEQGRQWLRSQAAAAADGGSTACEHAI